MHTFNSSVILAFSGTLALTIIFWISWRRDGNSYLKLWFLSWLSQGFRFPLEFFFTATDQTLFLVLSHAALLFSTWMLFRGTLRFTQTEEPLVPQLILAAAVLYSAGGALVGIPAEWLHLPVFTVPGVVYIWTGFLFLRSEASSTAGGSVSAWSFIVWGLHLLDYPIVSQHDWLLPWGFAVAWVLAMLTAMGLLMSHIETLRNSMHESSELIRLFSDQNRDVVFRYRLLPTPGFDYVSPSIFAVSGYPVETFYHNPELAVTIFHPEDRELIPPPDRQEQTVSTVRRVKHRDGHNIWVDLVMVLVRNSTGDLIAVEGTGRDISTLKNYQIELRRRNRELEELADNISQNLKTPIRQIRSFAGLIADSCESDDRIMQLSTRIQSVSERVGLTARNLRWASQSVRRDLQRSLLDLTRMTHDVIDDLRKRNPFWIHPQITVEEGIAARGDAYLIHIVLHALLSNALKFSSTQTTQVIEVCAVKNGDHEAGLQVRDNGIGFDDDQAELLFLPAYRLHADQFEEGAGIGLSVARRIIDRHGGRIWAVGRAGIGATFSFCLPTAPLSHVSEIKT